jgi:hypothetical protein
MFFFDPNVALLVTPVTFLLAHKSDKRHKVKNARFLERTITITQLELF